MVSRRTPEAPRPRLMSFSAIISRTIGAETWLADAGGVRQHQIALQRFEIAIGDPHIGELAEAGIDAVDGLALGDDRGHRRGGPVDLREHFGRERKSGAARELRASPTSGSASPENVIRSVICRATPVHAAD